MHDLLFGERARVVLVDHQEALARRVQELGREGLDLSAIRRLRLLALDAALLDVLLAADNKHEGAGLVPLHGRLGNHHLLGAVPGLDDDRDEGSGDKKTVGIGKLSANGDRPGRGIDGIVDEHDLAVLGIPLAVRQHEVDIRVLADLIQVLRGAAAAANGLKVIPLADREADVHRRGAHQPRNRAGLVSSHLTKFQQSKKNAFLW